MKSLLLSAHFLDFYSNDVDGGTRQQHAHGGCRLLPALSQP